jgi:phosphoethanolamine N-methyltransferase
MAWGEDFLSPGGTDEVDRVLDNNDFSGAIIRDIGCGIGGAAVHLAKTRQPKHITGIAIERNLVYRAQALADKNNVSPACQLQRVDPGPLPFDPESFDVVFGKDAIIHIPDKVGLAKTVFEVLRPNGRFMASDWLCGYDGDPYPLISKPKGVISPWPHAGPMKRS